MFMYIDKVVMSAKPVPSLYFFSSLPCKGIRHDRDVTPHLRVSVSLECCFISRSYLIVPQQYTSIIRLYVIIVVPRPKCVNRNSFLNKLAIV